METISLYGQASTQNATPPQTQTATFNVTPGVELRAQLKKVTDKIKAIKEKSGDSLDQKSTLNVKKLLDDGERLQAEIKSEDGKELEFRVSQLNGIAAGAQTNLPEGRYAVDPNPPKVPARQITLPRMGRGLKVFNRGEKDIKLAYDIGQYVGAIVYNNGPSIRYCLDNGLDIYNQAHVEGINTAGGVWVPLEWGDRIIELVDTYGKFRMNASPEPMNSDSKSIRRRKRGYTAKHRSETGPSDAQDPNIWNNLDLVAKFVDVFTEVSDSLSEDALPQMADSMTVASAEAFALREDADGFYGPGDSTSGGILGVMVAMMQGTKKGAVTAAAGHNNAGNVDFSDIAKLMGMLPQYAEERPTAKFYMSKYFYNSMAMRIMYTQGGSSSQDVAAGTGPEFLGAPVVMSSLFPAEGDHTGVPLLIYGNLMIGSVFGDRRALQMRTQPQIKQNIIEVKWSERYDIKNHGTGNANEAGAFVVLVGG